MIKLNRILVPYDFSAMSEEAALLALHLAKAQEAEIHMFTVDIVQDDLHDMLIRQHQPDTHPAEMTARLREASQRLLDEVGLEPGDLQVKHTTVRDRAPAPAIVQYAEEQDIDLIVAGTHGRRGIRRAVLGSVAAEVLRTAPCPMLTVRDGAWRATQLIRKVLVPLDFSEPSRGAIQYAASLAALFGTRLHAIHVLDDVNSEEIYGLKPSIFGISESYKYARKKLRSLTTGLPVKASLHVLNGLPAGKITSFANQKDVDLIVMPTRGRTGLQRLFLGSVAERVISTAPCPVLSAKDFQPYLKLEELQMEDRQQEIASN